MGTWAGWSWGGSAGAGAGGRSPLIPALWRGTGAVSATRGPQGAVGRPGPSGASGAGMRFTVGFLVWWTGSVGRPGIGPVAGRGVRGGQGGGQPVDRKR